MQEYGLKNDGKGLELSIADGTRLKTFSTLKNLGIQQRDTLFWMAYSKPTTVEA
jgi:hypothetical protein